MAPKPAGTSAVESMAWATMQTQHSLPRTLRRSRTSRQRLLQLCKPSWHLLPQPWHGQQRQISRQRLDQTTASSCQGTAVQKQPRLQLQLARAAQKCSNPLLRHWQTCRRQERLTPPARSSTSHQQQLRWSSLSMRVNLKLIRWLQHQTPAALSSPMQQEVHSGSTAALLRAQHLQRQLRRQPAARRGMFCQTVRNHSNAIKASAQRSPARLLRPNQQAQRLSPVQSSGPALALQMLRAQVCADHPSAHTPCFVQLVPSWLSTQLVSCLFAQLRSNEPCMYCRRRAA